MPFCSTLHQTLTDRPDIAPLLPPVIRVSVQNGVKLRTRSNPVSTPQRLVWIYGRMDYEPTNSHSYSQYVQDGRPTVDYLTPSADAAEERARQRVIVSHQLSAPRDITHAMRTQFGGGKDGAETSTGDLGVQVQIEQAVMVDYDPVVCGRENYRKPRVIWDRKRSTANGDGERSSAELSRWELSSVRSVAKTTDTV